MTKEELIELKKQLSTLTEEEQKERDIYLRGLASGEIQGPPVGYPSIDKPWLKYYEEEKLLEEFPNQSIYQYAFSSNEKNMDNIAIDMRSSSNDFNHGIKITYKEFFKKIQELAKSSVAIGMKQDEIIPLILPNTPEARMLIYSNSFIGSTSYPISPLLPANQLKKILEDNSIKTIFIFRDFLEKYADVLSDSNVEHIVCLDGMESLPKPIRMINGIKSKFGKEKLLPILNDNRVMSWDAFCNLKKKITWDIEPYYDEGHIAAIIGTSGTTGTPKGVCLTDANINGVAFAYKNGEYFDGKFMDALIPSIGYGISMIHYQTVDGRYVYLIPELLTTKFPDALKKLNPQNFPGGPVHYINLKNSGMCLKNVGKNLISGGATLPKVVEESLNGITEGYSENSVINDNLIVRQGYGLSENTAMGAYCKRGTYKFGSIGIPIIYENIGIFTPDTDEELGYGEQGEICITGPTVMEGYLNNAEETEKVIKIHKDGKKWIHTKDIGYMDESGNIFMIDRIKNIFMRKGFNVHPSKIAEFINSLPYVNNCVVIGFEHPEEQAVPVAFVEINDEALNEKDLSTINDELKISCYRNLEETSVPIDFVFVDELPINVGGKIDLQQIQKVSEIDLPRDGKVLKKSIKFKK